jgi:hypothetical protein
LCSPSDVSCVACRRANGMAGRCKHGMVDAAKLALALSTLGSVVEHLEAAKPAAGSWKWAARRTQEAWRVSRDCPYGCLRQVKVLLILDHLHVKAKPPLLTLNYKPPSLTTKTAISRLCLGCTDAWAPGRDGLSHEQRL